MKKSFIPLTLIIVASFTLSAMFTGVATANPAPLFAFPQEPVTTLPTIAVYSPVENQVFTSSDMLLNFTITKPQSWFAFNAGSHEDFTPITETFVNITTLYYVVDGGEPQNISIHDVDSLTDTSPTLTLNFSTTIPLTSGAHTVKVCLEAVSYYVINFVDWYHPFSNVTLHADSETVNFAVTQPIAGEQVVLLFAIAGSTSVVAVGAAWVYVKRHKR